MKQENKKLEEMKRADDEWAREFEDFMGYMATHPEEFPEEHALMDSIFADRRRRKEERRRRAEEYRREHSHDAFGDVKTPFLEFCYRSEDENKVTKYLRGISIIIGSCVSIPWIFIDKKDPRNAPSTSTAAVMLVILSICFLTYFIASFAKLRIRKECRWKYGWGTPPASVTEKLKLYLSDPKTEKLTEQDRKYMWCLVNYYPHIIKPAKPQKK